MISKSFLVENNESFFIQNDKILFYGENVGLINDFKNNIRKTLEEYICINLHQEEIITNQNTLSNEMQHASLFNDKKLVFVNNATDKILPALELVLEIETENKLIIISSTLDKKSKLREIFEKSKKFQTVPCYPDNELNIKKILFNKLNGYQGLSSQNINMIINCCSNDRVKLNNELDKIKIFFANKKIETKKLEFLLNQETNDDFNLLKDEAIKGNKSLTNKLLGSTFFENDKANYYLNTINKSFMRLSEISKKTTSLSIEETINQIKPPVFWKDKPNLIMQSKKWNSIKIKKVLKDIYSTEIKVKTSSVIKKDLIIKKLILDICNLANS